MAIQTTIKKEFSENNHNYVVEVTNDTVKIVVDNISIYKTTIEGKLRLYYMDIVNDIIVFTSQMGGDATEFSIIGITLDGKELFHYSNNIDPNVARIRISSQKYSIDKDTNTIYIGGTRKINESDVVMEDGYKSICDSSFKENDKISGNYKIDMNDINNVKMEFVEITETVEEYRKMDEACKEKENNN